MTKNLKKKIGKTKSSKSQDTLKVGRKTSPGAAREIQQQAVLNFQAGNLKKAEQLYKQYLVVEPNNKIGLYHLAIISHQTGENDEAVRLLRQAISINPDFVDAYNLLGIVLEMQGDLDSSVQCYKKVISLSPDYFEAHNNLGKIYSISGKIDMAIIHFIEAICLNPQFVTAQRNLEKTLLANINIESDLTPCCRLIRSYITHAFSGYWNLAKALQNCGFSRLALAVFSECLPIEPNNGEVHRSISKLKRFCPGDQQITDMENILSNNECPLSDRMHISFALGKAYEDCKDYERSFEYLREANTLKRNSFQYSYGETLRLNNQIKNTFNTLLGKKKLPRGNPDKTPVFVLGMPRSGTSLVEQVLASHPNVYGAGELEELQQSFLKTTQAHTLINAFRLLEDNPDRIIPGMAAKYLHALRTIGGESSRVTDKMPINFQFIGLIRLAFPKAKIIHCQRDPMDTCFSIFKNYFEGWYPYAYDMKELGEYYLCYQDLMHYWRSAFPESIYDITYEKLVNDHENEIRKLLKACDLEWNDECLYFHRTARRVATASAAQVRQPVYADSVDIWRKYEKNLQPLITTLGHGDKVEKV